MIDDVIADNLIFCNYPIDFKTGKIVGERDEAGYVRKAKTHQIKEDSEKYLI